MQAFLVQSILASVVLTLVLNLLPRLFPKATDRAEQRIHEQVRRTFDERERASAPGNETSGASDGVPHPRGGARGGSRVKVFFPWKAMLGISLALTVLVNLAGYFSGS